MVLDRDAVHWHQGRRNMNLERKKQIRLDRRPYVERLLPVQGFRKEVPIPRSSGAHRAAYGRPRDRRRRAAELCTRPRGPRPRRRGRERGRPVARRHAVRGVLLRRLAPGEAAISERSIRLITDSSDAEASVWS